jgi:hypothetical protein
MEEIWKDVKFFEGIYQVSNLGRVKSLERKANTWFGERTVPERFLSLKPNKQGYIRVLLCNRNKYNVHRLVAEAFIPNICNKPFVNHINNKPSDNRVENLEWCTQEENIRHCIISGRKNAPKGERHHWFGQLGENHPTSKKVYCIRTNKIFGSVAEAADFIGIKRTTLIAQLRGQNPNKTTIRYI